MKEVDIKWHNIGVVTVFIVCMYFGFEYNSSGAFLGAIISFLSIK